MLMFDVFKAYGLMFNTAGNVSGSDSIVEVQIGNRFYHFDLPINSNKGYYKHMVDWL